MHYRPLGNTGVKVSELCLGTAFRGQDDEQTCIRVIDRALDLGCNFIDSAFYGQGRSETVVGKTIKDKREDVFLCTKIFGTRHPEPNNSGLTRLNLIRGVEDSLTRLQTDHIDLYLLHSFDPNTPLEETLRALDDMVRSGKIRYIGCSNFSAWKIIEALWQSDKRNLARFVCIQNQYNLLNRWEIEPDLMPVCSKHGLGMMTYSPLAIGLLSGHFRRGQPPAAGTRWSGQGSGFERVMTESVDGVVQTLIDIAAELGKTPAQVAFAWILDHPEITAAISGPDLPEHIEEVCGSVGWQLDKEARDKLDEVSSFTPLQNYA
mgnify:CR=1 FL=1